jgi:transcriptional regulator with XRE-family HTH domain
MNIKLGSEKIEAILRERGMTQAELAKKTGKRKQWISHVIKTHNGSCTLKTINCIASALNVDPRELIDVC